ncbi:hypothetical protein QFZ75_002461 [Streptomyces sp. V3I8]|uniref:hypothetical protein n=1 Tax=Streptomyces sp. V3I8 TaxID=3042279 RepID=UPI00278AF3FA|nr:hypothetical protein [Streptomyces sp. V3I8]MDQ1036045.1 hypothetical protein [Streptomyces sp. V3I8]
MAGHPAAGAAGGGALPATVRMVLMAPAPYLLSRAAADGAYAALRHSWHGERPTPS